eukprot:4973926-Prymnesium_polylepis.1
MIGCWGPSRVRVRGVRCREGGAAARHPTRARLACDAHWCNRVMCEPVGVCLLGTDGTASCANAGRSGRGHARL